MDITIILEFISALWPVILGLGSLIVVLAKMHYSIESLSEKVKILFDFHNNKKD